MLKNFKKKIQEKTLEDLLNFYMDDYQSKTKELEKYMNSNKDNAYIAAKQRKDVALIREVNIANTRVQVLADIKEQLKRG